MNLCFVLTMPGVNSWNGKWTGEGKLYAKIEKFTTIKRRAKAAEILSAQPYFYRWDDGWCAKIEVREVDIAETRLIKRNSKGFCGYEWMIVSIIDYGKIYADHQRPETKAA